MRAWCIGLAVCVLLGACERAKRDMYDQPRYRPYRASPLFSDGNSSRPSPPESVIHSAGNLAGTTSGRHGGGDVLDAEAAQRAQALPSPLTHELMERGRERYNIYCSPCHSIAGDGDGLVARRGFPHPPSYHVERLRKAPDRHFYDVITNGYGAMHSYADRVAPRDRWAIVAYIRALQFSQSAPMSALPEDVRARLAGSDGAQQ